VKISWKKYAKILFHKVKLKVWDLINDDVQGDFIPDFLCKRLSSKKTDLLIIWNESISARLSVSENRFHDNVQNQRESKVIFLLHYSFGCLFLL
jgi:hypothetical protein